MKAVKAFFITLLIVLLAGAVILACLYLFSDREHGSFAEEAKKKTVEYAARRMQPAIEEAVTSGLSQAGFSKEEAQQLVDSIPQEDKEKLIEIAASHTDSINEVSSYIRDGDTEGLTVYLQDTLNEEELQTITDMLGEYLPAGTLPEGILPEDALPEGVLPEGVLPEGMQPEGGVTQESLPGSTEPPAAPQQ